MKDYSVLAESKLIILHLIYKISLPVSLSYIQEFTLDSAYMDYFSLSKYLAELIENEYLDRKTEKNKTYYSLTKKGFKTLSIFSDLIPNYIKNKVEEYVNINKLQIKKELDIKAIYTENSKNEFLVECGVYENNIPSMEMKFKVATKKYAITICDNWKKDASKYYINFIKSLLEN